MLPRCRPIRTADAAPGSAFPSPSRFRTPSVSSGRFLAAINAAVSSSQARPPPGFPSWSPARDLSRNLDASSPTAESAAARVQGSAASFSAMAARAFSRRGEVTNPRESAVWNRTIASRSAAASSRFSWMLESCPFAGDRSSASFAAFSRTPGSMSLSALRTRASVKPPNDSRVQRACNRP